VNSGRAAAVTETQPSLPSPTATSRFELPTRTLSGIVLAAIMVGSLIVGGWVFPIVVVAAAIAAVREWHRLLNAGRLAPEMIPTSLAVAGAAVLAHIQGTSGLALLVIILGGAAAAGIAALRRLPMLWPLPWHAFGALYIGLTVLALVILRDQPHGIAKVGALFVTVWTADTGALMFGRMIGGPKLAPDLSPNKTWAGFLGGTAAAAAAEVLYVFFLDGSPGEAVLFGIALAIAGHVGDLFESWVKRQFHAKNTGRLIPGHGGMLDRIDSLLFAAPICALLVCYAGFDPFSGVVP
jgi:phosphatidate cytidylyltransferase